MNLEENPTKKTNTHHIKEEDYIKEVERLKQELLKSQQEKKDLFECSSVGYIIIDSDYKILDVNDAACSLLGIEPFILKNSYFNQLFSDNTRKIFISLLETAYSSKKRAVNQVKILTKNLKLHLKVEAKTLDQSENCIISLINLVDIPELSNSIDSLENEKIHASIDSMKKLHNKTGNIISKITDRHLLLDKNGKIKDVNSNALKDLGLSKDDVTGKYFREIFKNLYSPELEIYFKNALTTNAPSQFEISIEENCFTEFQIYPVEEGLLIYFREISKQKQHEDTLNKIEMIYRAIGESINYGIWICAPDGQNVYASDTFLELVGQTQEQCSSFGWGDVLHPDDSERTIEAWKKCVKEGDKWDIEHRYKGIDGQWHHILARGVPVKDKDGNVFCWAGINLDIDQQKHTQQELQKSKEREKQRANELEIILDALPAVVWISRDPEGNEIYGNRIANELLHVSKSQNVSKKHENYAREIKFCRNGIEIPFNELPIQTALKVNFVENYEMELVYPDNSVVYLIGNASRIVDNNGNTQGAVAAFVNITSFKNAQKELAQSEIKLQRLNHTKDKLFIIIAHDLRNPFTSLMGFAEVLMNQHESYSSEEIEKYLSIIHDSAKQAHNLLENLLNWSRSQTGALEIKPERLNIRSLMVNNIKMAHNMALKKEIHIALHVEKDLFVYADKNMMDAVIRNLLSNAVKFSYPGSKINVSASKKDDHIEITIKDYGVGIDKNDLSKLFNIDNKFTSLGTNKEKGSGLGLVLCKEFVEKNNGKISIRSDAGKGCTVSIILPEA